MAPPEIAMISKAEPVFMKRPRFDNASGQIAGQTNALAKPNNATKMTEVIPDVKITPNEKTTPNMADNCSANR